MASRGVEDGRSTTEESFLRYCSYVVAPLDVFQFVAVRGRDDVWRGLAYPAGTSLTESPLFVVRDADHQGLVGFASMTNTIEATAGVRGILFSYAVEALEFAAQFGEEYEPLAPCLAEDLSEYLECLDAAYVRAKELVCRQLSQS